MTKAAPEPYGIGGLLNQAHRLARAAANEAMRPEGVELRHLSVLGYVSRNGPQRQHQVGEALGLDKSTLVRIIDDLEAQGFAERTRATDDRRAYEVSITPDGERRLRVAWEHANAAMADLLSPLTPEEHTKLHELLERFVDQASKRTASSS